MAMMGNICPTRRVESGWLATTSTVAGKHEKKEVEKPIAKSHDTMATDSP